jgi:hypothetical protein
MRTRITVFKSMANVSLKDILHNHGTPVVAKTTDSLHSTLQVCTSRNRESNNRPSAHHLSMLALHSNVDTVACESKNSCRASIR